MDIEIIQREYRKLNTPKAASIAGILFALLFALSLILLRLAIPEAISTETNWIESGKTKILLALRLMPFAGVSFLWFVGVVRDHFGEFEDKFFSTVFFGSSILFLAMVFTSMAVIGSILFVAENFTVNAIDEGMVYFGRSIVYQLSNIFGLRMASVFMLSLGSSWLGTGIYPRWLVIITFLIAVVLLFVVNFSLWMTLLFPAWVLLISVYNLLSKRKAKPKVAATRE